MQQADKDALVQRIERGILEQFYDKMQYEFAAELKENKVDLTDKILVEELQQYFLFDVVWSDVFKRHE
ncbi:hypothetical protein N9A81_01880 [Synechococcus sp. AH-707-M23]|nr:hypothetical protein [Synechococcus sp. AH-707-M23]